MRNRAARLAPVVLAVVSLAAPSAAQGKHRAKPPKGDQAMAQHSLRPPVTREHYYFVMADRFANGSPANDRGGLGGDRSTHGFDDTDRRYYHGDLRAA